MRRLLLPVVLVISLILALPGWSDALEVTLYRIESSGLGETIGSITALDSDDGLVIEPHLAGLIEGEHGFHLHSNGGCDPGVNADGVAGGSRGRRALGSGVHQPPPRALRQRSPW